MLLMSFVANLAIETKHSKAAYYIRRLCKAICNNVIHFVNMMGKLFRELEKLD